MGQRIHDITFATTDCLPTWPGTSGYKREFELEMPESVANSSFLSINSHYGTHLDAPYHFCENGKKIDEIPLERLIGRVSVREVLGTERIRAEDLGQLDLPQECTRLLLKTDNALLWQQNRSFYPDFTALDESGAEWLLGRENFDLIGIDYLSIQKFEDGPEVHQLLLGKEILILESLNLAHIEEGEYEMICLPLKIEGAEAAPARVVLIEK